MQTAHANQPSTWNEMVDVMFRRRLTHNERMGQAFFNALYDSWPELADLVRATDCDPFYVDAMDDPRMVAFLNFIAAYFI